MNKQVSEGEILKLAKISPEEKQKPVPIITRDKKGYKNVAHSTGQMEND